MSRPDKPRFQFQNLVSFLNGRTFLRGHYANSPQTWYRAFEFIDSWYPIQAPSRIVGTVCNDFQVLRHQPTFWGTIPHAREGDRAGPAFSDVGGQWQISMDLLCSIARAEHL